MDLLKVTKVPSENPQIDQWRFLAQYSYTANIHTYLQSKGLPCDNLNIEFIAGCIRQSDAYFTAAINTPLDISPLLLYYGATNLLIGIAAMLQGAKPDIQNHGLILELPSTQTFKIADVQVKPVNPSFGALQFISNIFSNGCKLANGTSWSFEEILGSIPDLRREYDSCYPLAKPFAIAVDVVKLESRSLDRINFSEVSRFNTPEDMFNSIENFSKYYLTPQIDNDLNFIILNRKKNANEAGIYSMYGRKYLSLGHRKSGNLLTPNQIVVMFMGLFVLGYLSRYHPEIWNPFVRSDNTGEKLVIEKFLSICTRYLPNLTLSHINNTQLHFINEIDGFLDLSNKR